MPAFKQQEYDYIERTKKILRQKCMEGEEYEANLIVNSFFGLLVIIQAERLNVITPEIVTEEKRGIDAKRIIKSIRKGTKEIHDNGVNTIVRHMRNSLSHFNFTIIKGDSDIISEIEFTDQANGKETFNTTLTIAEIKRFLDFFSSYLLTEMKPAAITENDVTTIINI